MRRMCVSRSHAMRFQRKKDLKMVLSAAAVWPPNDIWEYPTSFFHRLNLHTWNLRKSTDGAKSVRMIQLLIVNTHTLRLVGKADIFCPTRIEQCCHHVPILAVIQSERLFIDHSVVFFLNKTFLCVILHSTALCSSASNVCMHNTVCFWMLYSRKHFRNVVACAESVIHIHLMNSHGTHSSK